MSETKIRIRDAGPLLVEGPVRIVDAEGTEFVIPAGKPSVALCRCGASLKKPFCDGTHKSTGFTDCVRATPPAPPAENTAPPSGS